MAKEKFLIVAVPMMDDCFARFSETANREAISNGTADHDEAYSWIEKSFEIVLVRDREATHICSFTPSQYYVWLQNAFAGQPNAAWEDNADPEGLERESGGEWHGYKTYHDAYDSRFIVDSFTLDTMKILGLRKPRDMRSAAGDAYVDSIWKAAEQIAMDIGNNGGFDAPILGAYAYRIWENEQRETTRRQAIEKSHRAAADGAWALVLSAEA